MNPPPYLRKTPSTNQQNMAAPDRLVELVNLFRTNHDVYSRADYKEAHVRQEFIDPMFELLGWDMSNAQGFAEQYKDVVHEASLKIGKATKAPDYSFRIGGVRKFFLEAKKPSTKLKEDVPAAFQVRRYAWSAGLPLSILTDFEEFAVYDCRIEPHRHDKASVARVLYFTFEEYAEKWEELASIFSKEAILKGSFDRYAESTKKKRGTAEVDDAFLAEIEEWREMLARDIAMRNVSLSVRELNQAVQVTIDRIIFLRIAEDRGAEPYGQLQSLKKGKNVYRRLVDLYHHADNRYNSGLFHFAKEKGRDENFDEWTTKLKIEDSTLQEVFRRLYYPDSPYEFSVLPGSILGQVYERFLGNVISLDANRNVTVEAKPEVRKAGGVFYTPDYITRTIVRETLGKAIEGKTPEEITTLRVLDPACGSGSFLLTAYDFLLDWSLDWYSTNNPEKHTKGKNPQIYRVISSDPESPPLYRLTTRLKKEILLNNIFGVDIDAQAVEVTKLSLLLRVLEDENEETLGAQLSLAERVLPDLERNIKCGNSLIDSEFYDSTQMSLLDEETIYRVNTFNWREEFLEIMANGGFDVIIGNPPYIRIQHLKEWAQLEVEHYKTAYRSAAKGNYDIYVVFVEKGLELLRKGGRLGYILPHKFFNAKYGEALRELIAEGKHLRKVVHFGDAQIFSGATTYTSLLFLTNEPNTEFQFEKVDDLELWRLTQEFAQSGGDDAGSSEGVVNEAEVTAAEWNFIIGPGRDLFKRLNEMPVKLGDVALRIFQGLKTGSDKIFIVSEISENNGIARIFCPEDGNEYNIEARLLHPLVKGGDSRRYCLSQTERRILFPYESNSGNAQLIDRLRFMSEFPLTWDYLSIHKEKLESREHGAMKGEKWFGYSRNQALDVISLCKIFTPDIAPTASFSLDQEGGTFFTGGAAGGYGIIPNDDVRFEYLLSVLNSNVLEWYLKEISSVMRGGWYSFESRYISQLPIRTIDLANTEDVRLHDQIVQLVKSMLDLHKRLSDSKSSHDKTMLTRQIEATDKQIDRLVYELYG
ncbi:MAG: N-6 DNA methylase [Candidatus Kapaibacterium sp.]